MAEEEYKTETTLPEFADRFLGKDFRVSSVFSRDKDLHDIPGLEVLNEADILLVSARRRLPTAEQLTMIRRFVESGKAVIGIRTASHAFAPRPKFEMPPGHAAWPEFDAQVLGGNYHNHFNAKEKVLVKVAPEAGSDPILTGVRTDEFAVGSSLYKTSPLAQGAKVLMMGRIAGQPAEPVAWTFQRKDGGKTFYTSLGHVDDFKTADFQRLLLNACYWAAGRAAPKQ
jgi:type 1 glutamine amidotransferase